MATTSKPPTGEIGSILPDAPVHGLGTGAQFWSTVLDEGEYVPELKWPRSRKVYDQMARDGQIKAMWYAITLPIRQMDWRIDPNGSGDVARKVAEDLGLSLVGDKAGDPVKRTARRFNFDELLVNALTALRYGFAFFEQVGEVRADPLEWRLQKLAPRLAPVIDEIRVSKDGGLKEILQRNQATIPVSQLVAFIWEKEGGNWYGESIFRGSYKYWALKDKLIRIDAINKERNGAGIPWAKITDPEVDDSVAEKAFRAAIASRAGRKAGGALPYGVEIEYKGINGTIPDTISSIRYMDEQMTRSTLTTFLQLGQTQSGSRSLGETMVDFFSLAINSICNWIARVVNEHIIEDWVEWNVGSTAEYAPLLVWNRKQASEMDVAELANSVAQGLIRVDDPLRAFIRDKLNLPIEDPTTAVVPQPTPSPEKEDVDDETPGPKPSDQSVAAARKQPEARGVRAATSETPLPREPDDHELAVDWTAMQSQLDTGAEDLVAKWLILAGLLKTSVVSQVRDADGDLPTISAITATVGSTASMVDAAQILYKQGIDSAKAEAKAQGAPITGVRKKNSPDVPDQVNALLAVMAADYVSGGVKAALRLTGPATTSDDVANQVGEYYDGLTTAYPEAQLGGLASTAYNAGRNVVHAAAEERDEPVDFYASELLDTSTCPKCAAVDGTNYDTLAEALKDYPTGKYKLCDGRERCRGTVVARYEEVPNAA